MQLLTELLCWAQDYPLRRVGWAGKAGVWVGRSAAGFPVRASLWAALAVGVGLRAAIIHAGRAPFNSDEAVVALMARHILQGERPVFFYGQAYMGSLDAYLAAGGFLLFGQHIWVLRLVQLLLYAGTILAAAKATQLVFGSERHAALAAWLLAVPPVNAVLYTTVTLGGYGEMLLLSSLELLVALRIATHFAAGREPPWQAWVALGLLAGLGFWVFGLTLVFTLPVCLYLAWRWKLRARRLACELQIANYSLRGRTTYRTVTWKIAQSVAGFCLGSAPWWAYALRFGPGRLVSELAGAAIAGVEGSGYFQQVGQHLANLLLFGLPAALGMRPPWEVRWLALPLVPLALAFWLGVMWSMLRALFHPDSRFMHTPSEPDSQMELGGERLLAWVALALAAGFVFTPFGADPSGRYLLPLLIPLAAFGAETLCQARQAWRSWAWALAGLVLAFNAWGTLGTALRFPPGLTTQFDAAGRIDQRDQGRLAAFLQARGETRGFTTYWVAYPLAFHSAEQLIFIPRLPYHQDFRYTERDDRYLAYTRAVAQASRVAYITAHQPWLDDSLRAGFRERGIAWRETRIGDFRVFYQLERLIRPEELGLGVTR